MAGVIESCLVQRDLIGTLVLDILFNRLFIFLLNTPPLPFFWGAAYITAGSWIDCEPYDLLLLMRHTLSLDIFIISHNAPYSVDLS